MIKVHLVETRPAGGEGGDWGGRGEWLDFEISMKTVIIAVMLRTF